MVAEIDGGNLTDELLSEGEEERIIDGGASLPVMGPGFVHGPCHATRYPRGLLCWFGRDNPTLIAFLPSFVRNLEPMDKGKGASREWKCKPPTQWPNTHLGEGRREGHYQLFNRFVKVTIIIDNGNQREENQNQTAERGDWSDGKLIRMAERSIDKELDKDLV